MLMTDNRASLMHNRREFLLFLAASAVVAPARAARAKRNQMILSSATSTAVEDVAKAYGTAPWYQLYMPRAWSDTEKLVKRVENAGCPVIAWTVDLLAGRNVPTATRFARQ